MKAAILYSGGKDSNRALQWAVNDGLDVEYLVTMFPMIVDSFMYHTPALNLVDLSSKAVGIPLVKGATSGIKEEEVEDLEVTLEPLDIECVVSGALESTYQKNRVDHVCFALGVKSYAPFWHHDLETHLRETIEMGFDVRFVGVSALGLDEKWLGRRLDHKALGELKELHEKYKVNLAGEGGEYETYVCDGPTFKQRIEFVKTRSVWDTKTGSGYLGIDQARLSEKRGPTTLFTSKPRDLNAR
jgi:predicted ATP pyrophosphatase (TIGR00289 family)